MPQHQKNNEGFDPAKSKGFILSSVIHIAFFVLLFTLTFKVHSPVPIPAEEGLLVNFGFDETGQGLFEPEPSPQQAPPAATPEKADDKSSDEAVVSQDFEEAPAVKKAKPTPEEIKRREDAIAAEKKRREEAEAERKRVEQEKAERLRKEEEQRRINEITNKTKNAFGNAGNTGTTGTSEGIAGGKGNQGVESGTPGVRNYGPGGGTGNTVARYDLSGRTSQSLPIPKYDYQGEGIVVVEVTVDQSGVVSKAVAGVKGSTTLDEYLLKVAKEAALKARFDSNPNAPVIQKGTITYNFKLK